MWLVGRGGGPEPGRHGLHKLRLSARRQCDRVGDAVRRECARRRHCHRTVRVIGIQRRVQGFWKWISCGRYERIKGDHVDERKTWLVRSLPAVETEPSLHGDRLQLLQNGPHPSLDERTEKRPRSGGMPLHNLQTGRDTSSPDRLKRCDTDLRFRIGQNVRPTLAGSVHQHTVSR
ncbi:hypothetical protein AAG570_005565 [Ranatra chinensis]|uniref:Uncharacterized protein n=1 Tax=Ranatra chinensis TaxID=642074 RepID=A0ABD0XZH3_9HEMI